MDVETSATMAAGPLPLAIPASTSSHRLAPSHVPGRAYRGGRVAPPEYLVPHPPPSYSYDARFFKDGEPIRGVDDTDNENGRVVHPPRSRAAVQAAIAAMVSNDEPPAFFWVFDADGKPSIARLSIAKSQYFHQLRPDHNLGAAGNRGYKLRPLGSLDAHHSEIGVEPNRLRFENAVRQDDELITSHAPKWNAYGRLAPWVSGATGPLTGQGEEEVGPSGMVAGEEGEIGERRPRRGDRETNDRLRLRIAALQRAGVRSLLTSPPPRHEHKDDRGHEHEEPEYRRRRSSSPLLPETSFKIHPAVESDSSAFLSTSALAPALLQPVLSPTDLLQSRTLRHTFRNPHIDALAKTTLDLGESEGEVIKSVGAFSAALELDDSEGRHSVMTATYSLVKAKEAAENKERRRKRRHDAETPENRRDDGTQAQRTGSRAGASGNGAIKRRRRWRFRTSFSPSILGSAGAGGAALSTDQSGEAGQVPQYSTSISLDELNPAFYKLDDLFITRSGLPIPVMLPDAAGVGEGEGNYATMGHDRQVVSPTIPGPTGSKANINALQNQSDLSTADSVPRIDGKRQQPLSAASQPSQSLDAKQGEGQSSDGANKCKQNTMTATGPGNTKTSPVNGHGKAAAGVSAGVALPTDGAQAQQEHDQQQILLPAHAQREILLASLSCLHDLAADSLEYLDRLNEVRGRLCEVRRKRDRLWRALRIWALSRLEEQQGSFNAPGDGGSDDVDERAEYADQGSFDGANGRRIDQTAGERTNVTTSSRSRTAANHH